MKERLEEQFEEYFGGVEIPELPNNIVTDAKKSVKRRKNTLSGFVKIASVAASCVLVAAVAAVLITQTDFNVAGPDGSGAAPAPPTANVYALSELGYGEENPYALSSSDENLKFIENLAYTSNATVTAYTARFKESGEKAHSYAEVTLIYGARYDAEIYVEYTDGVFEPLKDYKNGSAGNYRGLSYYLTKETAENGEPVNKLLVTKGGVKYYFTVQSSDEDAYLKCLWLLSQNN